MIKEKSIRKKGSYVSVLLGIFIVFFDQITKFFATEYLQTPIYINRFFSLDLSFNRGISWGLFYSSNQLFFYLISSIIALILFAFGFYIYNRFNEGYSIVSELLVFFGGISNLIDRFFYGGVVDFLAFKFYGFYFPDFNIADIFITTGVFFMFIKIIFYED